MLRVFACLYTKAVSIWLAALALFFLVGLATGCAAVRPSPLGEMMALTAKGEVACVRNDVVRRGREACR